MKIGVFDSGVGGESFVTALQERFPHAEVVYKEDREHLPYGDKTPEQLFGFALPIFKQFETEGCAAVLVACNTLSTNAIEPLRQAVHIPLIAVEPMVKPAAKLTTSGVIAVCATPGTLHSKRYAQLKAESASGLIVLEPDCSDWAMMIEHSRHNELPLEELVANVRKQGCDVIVLGCTHYHWIEDQLRAYAGDDIAVIQPIEPVLKQMERVLAG